MKHPKLAIFIFCLTLVVGAAYAASSVNVTVRAVVPSSLDLSTSIRSAPPNADPFGPGSAAETSIDFGTLTFDTTNNIWVASKYFTVFLVPTSSGRSYVVQQTNSGVVSGSDNLNNNLIMTPDYQTADVLGSAAQGPMPAGDSLGPAALSFGTNRIIYNGNAGQSRIVRAYYGLSTGAAGEPAGAQPITVDTPSGTYTGTITFSVVLS